MHSLDPTDFSHHDSLSSDHFEQVEQGGWNCELSDGLSSTNFTYDDGQLVDVQHSYLDSAIGHSGNDISHTGHELNYASTLDSIAQGYDTQGMLESHIHTEFSAYNPSHLGSPSFEHDLSTTVFYPETVGTTEVETFSAMPRSGSSPDYGAAESNEGWAKHKEELAESWANSGYYNMASSLQKDADYYHDKAAENLNT